MDGRLSRRVQAIIMAAVFFLALAVGLWGFSTLGLEADGGFWRKGSDGSYRLGSSIVTITPEGQTTHFVRRHQGEALEADMTITNGILRCVYSDGDMVEGLVDGTEILDVEGLPLWMSDGASVSVGGMEVITAGKGRLTHTLYRMGLGETEMREGMVMLLCLMLLYPLGALQFLYPDKMAFLLSRWYYAKPELSELGRKVERVSGVIMMILGVALGLLPLIL